MVVCVYTRTCKRWTNTHSREDHSVVCVCVGSLVYAFPAGWNDVQRVDQSMDRVTGGMAKYWIIPRVGDKELPRVGH